MSREQKIVIWLVGLVVAGFIVHLLNAVLMPFVVGMAIAYFFDPAADRLERLGLSRTLATTVILLGFFTTTTGIIVLVFPTLQEQVAAAVKLIPELVHRMQALAAPILDDLRTEMTPETMKEMKEAASKYAGTVLKGASGVIAKLWSGGLAILNLLSLILIMPLVAFYLLRDWDRIVAKIDGLLPRDAAPTIREQVKRIDDTLAGFVRGQASVCLSLAVFYAAGLSIAGLEAGLLVGIAAGLLAVIPYVGAFVGFFIGLGMAVAQFQQDWVSILIVAAVFLVGQTLESYFLTPKLVGGRIGLSPIWIIFAMLAGGALFGLTGVIIALPVAAIAGVLVRFGIEQYRQSELYLGDNGTGDQ